MKTRKILIFTALPVVVLLFIYCGCNPGIIGSVANNLRPQETRNWCWAAVTQMLAEHEGIIVKQCDLADHRFGMTMCCDPATPGTTCPKADSCNRPGWPMLDYAGLTFSESGAALSWADVRDEIYCDENPMGFAYGTPGVVGHVVVIKGYITLAGIDYVVLNDPWGPCVGSERVITYNNYVDPAGSDTHWATFYNIAKK